MAVKLGCKMVRTQEVRGKGGRARLGEVRSARIGWRLGEKIREGRFQTNGSVWLLFEIFHPSAGEVGVLGD